MVLLAMETSAPGGGVALLDDERVLAEEFLGEGQRHGQELLPACERLLRRAGHSVSSLSGVAVSGGPGSYTGLRIGAMAAKALSYATGAPLLPVSSLAALALTAACFPPPPKRPERCPDEHDPIVVVTVQTSRRDEVYAAAYHLNGTGTVIPMPGGEQAIAPEEACDLARQMTAWAESANGWMILAGNALSVYPEAFCRLPAFAADWSGSRSAYTDKVLIRRDLSVGSAAAVGCLARRLASDGKVNDPMQWQPLYLRRDPADAWRRDQLIAESR